MAGGLMTQAGFQLGVDLLKDEYNNAILKVPRDERPGLPSSILSKEGSLASHVAEWAEGGR